MESKNRNGLSYSEAGKIGAEKFKMVLFDIMKKRTADYNDNPKMCKKCNKPIEYKKRRNVFCSSSCSAMYYSVSSRRRISKSLCKLCKKETKSTSSTYCSNKCQNEYRWKIVKETIVLNGYTPKSSRISRRYLKEIMGIKCQICKTTEWMGKEVPLILDHIDGNSSNWKLSNLRLICGNCDMQTDTYKNKNIGKGRYSRRVRYREGKSY